MAWQRVPNTVQVDLVFLLFGQRVQNVYYVQFGGGVDAVSLDDAATTFDQWCTNNWMTNISVDCVYIGGEVRNLDIEAGSILAFAPAAAVAGGIPVAAEPGNVSFSISLRTGTAGRSFRGRKYVAGMPSTQRVGNTVQPIWAQDLIDSLNNLRTVLNGVNGVLVVVSRIADGLQRLEALATPVNAVGLADFHIDSQRRRLTGRGS